MFIKNSGQCKGFFNTGKSKISPKSELHFSELFHKTYKLLSSLVALITKAKMYLRVNCSINYCYNGLYAGKTLYRNVVK